MNLTSAWISRYISDLSELTTATQSTAADGSLIETAEAIDWVVERLKKLVLDGGKLMVVGNGGSAAIASHVAIDYSKNGKIPAVAFNDPASLTCLTNDLGYENVFSHHIQMLGNPQDLLFAISSSGRIPKYPKCRGCSAGKEHSRCHLQWIFPEQRFAPLGGH